MARPKAFDPDEVLDRAMRLFWDKGFEATSMQALVDATGVSRASLYGTYGDKEALFTAAMVRYQQRIGSKAFLELLPPRAGRAAIERFFQATLTNLVSPDMPRGCFAVNSMIAGDTVPSVVSAGVKESMAALEAALLGAMERDPALQSRRDLRSVARFLTTQTQGLGVQASAGTSVAELRESVRVALRVLDTPDAPG
jgi:TetR/AcrR family transcriptional repressor of nem operon